MDGGAVAVEQRQRPAETERYVTITLSWEEARELRELLKIARCLQWKLLDAGVKADPPPANISPEEQVRRAKVQRELEASYSHG